MKNDTDKNFIYDENGERIYMGEIAIKIWNLAIKEASDCVKNNNKLMCKILGLRKK